MITYWLIPALLCLSKYSSGFLTGFPKDQCDEMDPTKIPIESNLPKEELTDFNSTADYNLEEPPATSVKISTRFNLFRIATSPSKYRRGRTMDIMIRGPDFNAFMLQVRKIGPDERRGFDKPVRVGEFVSWPASLHPVTCDGGMSTALTNKNFAPKSDIVVKWKAPKDDVGMIHVVGRFVAGDEYWPLTEGREIPLNEFTVNLANCGKAKSCIFYSETSASCHEDNCDYILTYTVHNTTSVEFVLGGNAKGEQTYLAVGFSTSPEAEIIKMVACTRAKTVAEIKYFIVHTMEEGPVEHPLPLSNPNMDLDGDRMWCSFTLPMVSPADSGNGLDLSMPLFQVYMRGNTNYTKTINLPILPSKLLVSKKEMQVEKIKLQYHTMEKPKSASPSVNADLFAFLFELFSLLVPHLS